MKRRRPSSLSEGFTLLEAVVALALVGSVGIALFGWINSNLITLGRVDDVRARSEMTLNLVEFMQRVNPMLTPDGTVVLGRHKASWSAVARTPVVEGLDQPVGRGNFRLALYDVAVSVEEEDGRPWFSVQLQQVGYQRVRSSLVLD